MLYIASNTKRLVYFFRLKSRLPTLVNSTSNTELSFCFSFYQQSQLILVFLLSFSLSLSLPPSFSLTQCPALYELTKCHSRSGFPDCHSRMPHCHFKRVFYAKDISSVFISNSNIKDSNLHMLPNHIMNGCLHEKQAKHRVLISFRYVKITTLHVEKVNPSYMNFSCVTFTACRRALSYS